MKRLTDEEFKSLSEVLPASILDNQKKFYIGKGCVACDHSGYKGRVGIHEVLEMTNEVREAVMKKSDADEIRKIAIKGGMETMFEEGFQKAVQGATTIEEILRVIHE